MIDNILKCPACGKPSVITIEPMGVWMLVCETHNSFIIIQRNKDDYGRESHRDFVLRVTSTLLDWFRNLGGYTVNQWKEQNTFGESHIPMLEAARKSWAEND